MRRLILLLLAAACDDDPTPGTCADDEVRVTECGGCGPVDECLDPAPVCAATCEGDFTPCDDEGGVCVDGACLHNVCG